MEFTIVALASMLVVAAGTAVYVYLQYRIATGQNQQLQQQMEQATQTLQHLQEKLKI